MRNRPCGFEIYLANVKTVRTTAQIFVAFSEKLNFTTEVDIYLILINEKVYCTYKENSKK